MDFSKFDKQVDTNKLKDDVAEAKANGGTGYPEIEEGSYMCKVDKLELSTTKDGRPMVKAQFRILEGDYKNSCLFYNRVIFGTKNDALMIASAVGFLESLEPSEEVGAIVFESYSQFADLILDIAEDIDGALEYQVYYDPDAFQSISIEEVYEVE